MILICKSVSKNLCRQANPSPKLPVLGKYAGSKLYNRHALSSYTWQCTQGSNCTCAPVMGAVHKLRKALQRVLLIALNLPPSHPIAFSPHKQRVMEFMNGATLAFLKVSSPGIPQCTFARATFDLHVRKTHTTSTYAHCTESTQKHTHANIQTHTQTHNTRLFFATTPWTRHNYRTFRNVFVWDEFIDRSGK